jgi:CubicO group peptidase (beta-lactamase class C family)
MWLRAMSLTACGIAMVVNAEALPAQSSRETSVAPRASRVDALFADFAKPDGPGASVVVALGDSIVFARGYGLADVEHRLQ